MSSCSRWPTWLVITVLALGALWLPLIWLLGAQWSIYEQYNYGWAVPFLCLFLFWRRWSNGPIPVPDPKVGRVTPCAPSPVYPLNLTPKHTPDLIHPSIPPLAEPPSPPRPGTSTTREGAEGIHLGEGPTGRASGHERGIGNEGEVSNSLSAAGPPTSGTVSRHQLITALLITVSLALLPTRILQEANPLWRFASYALTAEVVVITLALVFFAGGVRALRHLAFPIVFFLVAVPWPTPIESAVIQSLTRLNTVAVIEIMNALGVAALAHGNVIEVSTGLLGIDEACSGIRSTQVVFMLALFFGEMCRLRVGARVALLAGGLAIAMLLNIGRTSILVGLAAHGGIALSEKWHDLTGVTVLLGCFTLIWLLSRSLQFRNPNLNSNPNLAPDSTIPARSSLLAAPCFPTDSLTHRPTRSLSPCLIVFAVSLLSVLGTELWFRLHERGNVHDEAWSVILPTTRAGFRETQSSPEVRAALRYDSAVTASWRNPDGTAWQFFYFRWNPATALQDRVRVHLAKSHRPEACLPAGGWKLQREFDPIRVGLPGAPVVFRAYEFSGRDPLFVFFAVREDGTAVGGAANMRQSHRARWQAAWEGNRGLGQRVIEIAISGARDAQHAEELLREELPRLIR